MLPYKGMSAMTVWFNAVRAGSEFIIGDVDCALSLVGCGYVLAVANQGQGVVV